MSDKKGVKALAFDHYGTLFNKHAVAEVIEQDFPGRGEEVAQLWFKTIKKYCWLSGMMERYLTWDDLTKRALVFSGKSLGLEITDELFDRLIQADLLCRRSPRSPRHLSAWPRSSTFMCSPWPRRG